MFYNHRNKKKIAIAAVIAAVIIPLWAIEVWKINKAFPRKTIESCGYNEWMRYTPDVKDYIQADVSISPLSCVILPNEEVIRDYPNNDLLSAEGRYNLLFELKVKNNSDTAVKITRLCAYFMYVSPFNSDWNAPRYVHNDDKMEIAGHEETVIKLTAIIDYEDWLPNSYERYIKENAYILISQYPVEKRLVFQIKE